MNSIPADHPLAAKHVIHHQEENEQDETLFLWASNTSVSTVATDLGEPSGDEVEINRGNILLSILRTKAKMALGEFRAHSPRGSLC